MTKKENDKDRVRFRKQESGSQNTKWATKLRLGLGNPNVGAGTVYHMHPYKSYESITSY